MKSSAAKGNESGGRCSLAARASRCGRHLSSIKEAPTGSPPRRASEVYGCGRAQPRMVARAGFFRLGDKCCLDRHLFTAPGDSK